jgi:WD40 repeat protein
MAERENPMKQRKCYLLMIVFMLLTLLLDACSFSVEVLPTPSEDLFTPTASPPGVDSITPTFTPFVPTSVFPAVTPTLIPIRADTIYMLETFMSVGEGEPVRSLAFTPDGTVLASAGGDTEDFAIHVWEVASGRPIGTLSGHSNIVWDMAFSPDGQTLATASSDRTAKIRDWRNGDILKSLDFPGEVVSVRFSPDGQSLAVGGVDVTQNQIQHATIWTFSAGSWEPRLKFPEYLNISAMAYSPDGRWLVGGGTSRNVQVWRTSDGTPVFTLNHSHQVSRAAISPDGATIATATCETVVNGECTEGGIWLWDLLTGRLIKKLAGFPEIVENVAFSADGSTLIAASRDGTLRFYNASGDQSLFEFTVPGGISALAVSPDGGLLATGSNNGEVHLWKVVYRQ